MAGNFKERFYRFMQGRYGMDDLNQFLSTTFIVLLLICVALNFISNLAGIHWLRYASSILNFIAIVDVVFMFYRTLSRNHAKRREENVKFLKRRRKAQNKKDYKYLKCPFCQQEMRVPRGEGKISVKCPKCGEKTIIKS